MKYYIIKPKSHDFSRTMIENIKKLDSKAEFVEYLCECDIAVLQKGWSNSKISVEEMKLATVMCKEVRESYLYTERYKVHLN